MQYTIMQNPRVLYSINVFTPCFDFHKTGECKYGDKCRFVHYGNISSSSESDTTEDIDDNSDSDSIDLDCY